MEETDPLLHSERIGHESTTTTIQSSEQNDAYRTDPDRIAVVCIIVTVMCERLAYYSVVANLILYCTSSLDISSSQAAVINLIFTGSVFLVPTFGGYIADVHTGKYKTILGSGFIYILGLILLFASSINYESFYGDQHHYKDSKRALFYGSLVLITIGSGGIKSNIGPLGAQQVECLGTLAVQSFFSWFYWFINFGAVIAHTVVAYVQQNVGHFDYGYLLAVVVMIVGQIIFRIGKNRYTTSQEEGSPFKEIFGICWASKCRSFGQISNENQGRHYGDVSVNRVRTFCKLLPIFGFVVVYFGIYAQIDSTFFLQSERLDIRILSKNLPVAVLGSFDNIAILILIPLMEIFIYPLLKRINRPPSLLQRMGLGMTFAVFSVVAAGILERYRKDDLSVHQTILNHTYIASSVSVFAQIPQFTLIGASEVFTIVSGMEFTYLEAPDLMKGLCMGLYMETAGLGTYFAVMIISIVEKVTKGVWFSDEINDGKTEYLFFLFAGIMFTNSILFICVAKRYAYSCVQSIQHSHDQTE